MISLYRTETVPVQLVVQKGIIIIIIITMKDGYKGGFYIPVSQT